MNALRIEKRLDSHILPELIPLIGKRVEIIVLDQEASSASASTNIEPAKTMRRAGSAKGLVTIAPNFDDPLPEFDEYTQ